MDKGQESYDKMKNSIFKEVKKVFGLYMITELKMSQSEADVTITYLLNIVDNNLNKKYKQNNR